MNKSDTKAESQIVLALEDDIKAFIISLPYWAKFLSDKLLSSTNITDNDIETAYLYLIENAGLKDKTEKPEINIYFKDDNLEFYKKDLKLSKLQNVEGVNALVENQTIIFSPNVTIIYGITGSGKTGYIRLLKKAFFSRAKEDIIPNINLKNKRKTIKANFIFNSGGSEYTLNYPVDSLQSEFSQYAVFDSKCVLTHLDDKNEFEFKPAGLTFFKALTEAFKKLEERINVDINAKNIQKNYSVLFDGDSIIKSLLQDISEKTKIKDLKKYLPFSEDDKKEKKALEEKKAQLQTLKIDKEIASLKNIRSLIVTLKDSIEENNKLFSENHLEKIKTDIATCITKEATAKEEGIENFKSEKIKNIGSKEWKAFIEAADNFAKQQTKENEIYPKEDDFCLLCHQPLSKEAQKLILKYWAFVKSQVEIEVKKAQELLDKHIESYKKIKFDLLPENTILHNWLSDHYLKSLKKLQGMLTAQKNLSEYLISDLKDKKKNERKHYQIKVDMLDTNISNIDSKIKEFEDKKPTVELSEIDKGITFLTHKEKLEQHILEIESYINDLVWIKKTTEVKRQLNSKKITDKEKQLSDKYYNQKYIGTFNNECKFMNGNFGIKINYTGSFGASFRQLKIKDYPPSKILSEGEQKVISLADFLTEMQLSDINRGIIFDDPVNSLDDERKTNIADRLVRESKDKQVIIFTHDLIFVSSIISACKDNNIPYYGHWIEKSEKTPGTIWPDNNPSFEKSYKTSEKAQQYYNNAKKCGPEQREEKIKNGFAALRTYYESLIIFDLFGGVVQRFNERVSVESLKDVYFDEAIKQDVIDGFNQCCHYMEGHSHSDRYPYKKPILGNLNEEIQRFNDIKKSLKKLKNK
jgi:hypothetical protein